MYLLLNIKDPIFAEHVYFFYKMLKLFISLQFNIIIFFGQN